jgi:hypothetical protein
MCPHPTPLPLKEGEGEKDEKIYRLGEMARQPVNR